MERNYELTAAERLDAGALEAEYNALLARYGAVTLELEALRVMLPQAKQRQQELINRILARHKITNYTSARIEGDTVICRTDPAIPLINGTETRDPI